MSDREFNLEVKRIMETYSPGFQNMSIALKKDLWRSIDKTTNQRLLAIREKLELLPEGQGIYKEATFVGLIKSVFSDNPDPSAEATYCFFEVLLKSLGNLLEEHRQVLLVKTLHNLLVSQDNRYLNYIGEIAVLEFFLRTGEYELQGIEEQFDSDLTNEKTADLLFLQKQDSQQVFVEVLNIRLDAKGFDEASDLEDHLRSKYQEKIMKKSIIPERIKKGRNLFVQPVMWTKDYEQLTKVVEWFPELRLNENLFNTPMVYVCRPIASGELVSEVIHIDKLSVD